jgi:hypothetical protein
MGQKGAKQDPYICLVPKVLGSLANGTRGSFGAFKYLLLCLSDSRKVRGFLSCLKTNSKAANSAGTWE